MKGVLEGSRGSVREDLEQKGGKWFFTVGNKSYVLVPCYRKVRVLAYTSPTYFDFLERRISTKQAFLGVAQCWAGFDKVYRLNT